LPFATLSHLTHTYALYTGNSKVFSKLTRILEASPQAGAQQAVDIARQKRVISGTNGLNAINTDWHDKEHTAVSHPACEGVDGF
jgi:hypothetical protein